MIYANEWVSRMFDCSSNQKLQQVLYNLSVSPTDNVNQSNSRSHNLVENFDIYTANNKTNVYSQHASRKQYCKTENSKAGLSQHHTDSIDTQNVQPIPQQINEQLYPNIQSKESRESLQISNINNAVGESQLEIQKIQQELGMSQKNLAQTQVI